MASSELTEWLSFSGAPEEKVSTFIQSINRKALMEGKSKDDEWLAQYAAACFSDDALVWYYAIGEEVQNSWKRLCPALLREFSKKPGAVTVEAEMTSNTVVPSDSPPLYSSLAPTPSGAPAPAPAAAPPALRPPVPSRSPQPTQRSSTTLVGYIELADIHTGGRVGYINSKGDKTITQEINEVLLVELPWTASRNPTPPVSLRMINSGVNDTRRSYAGIMGMSQPLFWWMLVACALGNTDWYIPGQPPTVTMSNVWTVHHLADTLELKILSPGRFPREGPERLYVGQYLPINNLAKDFISSNPKPRSEDMLCAYRKADVRTLPGFRKLRMVFRPI